MEEKNWFDKISLSSGQEDFFSSLFEEMSFEDYLGLVENEPAVTRTAFQRIYEMIISYGFQKYEKLKKEIIHYNIFDDPFFRGAKKLFGLDESLMRLVNVFKSGAQRLGPERRIVLLMGPVGGGKSTVLDILKRGLEEYSKTPQGKLYTLHWTVKKDDEEGKSILGLLSGHESLQIECPIFEDPLRLLLKEGGIRETVLKKINNSLLKKGNFQIEIEGEACRLCRFYLFKFLERYKGDWQRVFREHIRVHRFFLSEKDRRGIGTFQPVDEKNQDSSELTGDINYRKLAVFGAEDDPRVFNYRYGEFIVANRGILEFKEILKLDDAFLYPLLEATQSHVVKPKGFPVIDIDVVVIGHTNEAEYRKLQKNERMEAFKDRTIKINYSNIITLSNEINIYERDYGWDKLKDKHLAPHTLEMTGLWAVLTRLCESQKITDIIQKAKIYDGKTVPGFKDDIIDELKLESGAEREGMDGVSPRYIQDKIANCLVKEGVKCINPFALIGEGAELESGLEHHPLIGDKIRIERYKQLLKLVREEYEIIVKSDVQKAIAGDLEAVKVLLNNYLDNIVAYVQGDRVQDKFTGRKIEPDELLMRSVEENLDPPEPESRKNDFRRLILSKIGSFAREGKTFQWDSDERLRKALEKKLFEDRKDTIQLARLVSSVLDQETREKIEVVKKFLIDRLGYCEICAQDALGYVASVFARGEKK